MSYWVYVTLSCHNWKRNDIHYSGAYLFTSFVYCTNVYWSVIHGIKRKPHLSVVWNWYHFVAIAILHQPRPTDSADINTRLQLSDTSSIPPMHGGFLLDLMAVWPMHNQLRLLFITCPWKLFINIIENHSPQEISESKHVSLTHWGRVTHICVSKLTIIGSDDGLSPDRRQTIIWTNAGLLLIRPLGTFSVKT